MVTPQPSTQVSSSEPWAMPLALGLGAILLRLRGDWHLVPQPPSPPPCISVLFWWACQRTVRHEWLMLLSPPRLSLAPSSNRHVLSMSMLKLLHLHVFLPKTSLPFPSSPRPSRLLQSCNLPRTPPNYWTIDSSFIHRVTNNVIQKPCGTSLNHSNVVEYFCEQWGSSSSLNCLMCTCSSDWLEWGLRNPDIKTWMTWWPT
jgi:hypothetical protein